MNKSITVLFSLLFFVSLLVASVDNANYVKLLQGNYGHRVKIHGDFKDKSNTVALCPSLTQVKRDAKKTGYDSISISTRFDVQEIEPLLNSILKNEQDNLGDYYCFYHGQKTEFLVFHDLYHFLMKALEKKEVEDFYLLRVPDKNESYENAKNIKQFFGKHNFNGISIQGNHYFKNYMESLETLQNPVKRFVSKQMTKSMIYLLRTSLGLFFYAIDDGQNPVRSLLLSVSPTCFGLSLSFFMSSYSAFSVNIPTYTQDLFKYLDVEHVYKKYKKDIKELVRLLETDFTGKTGLLLQIMIPKNNVKNLVYRALPGGTPYHYCRLNLFAPSAKEELDAYLKFPKVLSDEFRIILNKADLLNPDSGVKFKMYYNDKAETITLYKEKLNQLCQKIALSS